MPGSNELSRDERIRACRADEFDAILAIVNAAAEAYRGVIPEDCWHEPYMAAMELRSELAAGVDFAGYDERGKLVGVMGIQSVGEVDLIRHAYVLPSHQGSGIGGQLLSHLRSRTSRPILIGTWTAATWAIRFYERQGFTLVPEIKAVTLLKRYWKVSDRQIECSVVLSSGL